MLAFIALMASPVPLSSGVPVGERPGPYSFLVATGSERGQQTCYICAQDTKPGTVIFTRRLTPEVGKLFAKLDMVAANASKEKGFKLWLTHLDDHPNLNAVADWVRTSGARVSPAGVYDDRDGPPNYKLSRDADVTVLVFVNKKVVTNLTLREGELTADAVAKAVAAVEKVAK